MFYSRRLVSFTEPPNILRALSVSVSLTSTHRKSARPLAIGPTRPVGSTDQLIALHTGVLDPVGVDEDVTFSLSVWGVARVTTTARLKIKSYHLLP